MMLLIIVWVLLNSYPLVVMLVYIFGRDAGFPLVVVLTKPLVVMLTMYLVVMPA